MSSDLRLLRELGGQLAPPDGPLPDDLRRRVLAGTTPARAYRSWRLTMMAGAVAMAVAVAAGLVSRPAPTVQPQVSEVQTTHQVLRLAADRLGLISAVPARPDQFVFSESVATFDQVNSGGWSLVDTKPVVLREWRAVDGSQLGLTQSRPVDRPSAAWRIERIKTSQLPTNSQLMYEFLYRPASDDIPATYAARVGPDELAFERAARALYLSQTSPSVQAAVFAAINRIPGVTVRAGTTDVTGRRGVALVRAGSLGTAELIFDPADYRYLGMNLTFTQPAATGLMTRLAVQRVAVVDHAGELP